MEQYKREPYWHEARVSGWCTAIHSLALRGCILRPKLAVLLLIFGLLPRIANGQQKYFPDHPEVQAMVQRGLRFLEGSQLSSDTGVQVLVALAIVESSKRYDAAIPVENQLVQSVVARVLGEIESGKLQETDSVYYPCLALILLCDMGADKYRDQIDTIIRDIVYRQEPSGAFTYNRRKGQNRGDTSQTQYAALALWVAYKRGFNLPIEAPQKALQWLLDVNQPNGGWYYEYVNNQRMTGNHLTLSIQAAAGGTVYLLGDFLQLNPKSRKLTEKEKALAAEVADGDVLPPTVSIYVPPKENGGFEPIAKQDGPLARVDRAQFANVKRKSNEFLYSNFSIEIDRWGYYYLYALERYAFFRERAEGSVKEIPDWYDQGVELLKTRQGSGGAFQRGKTGERNEVESTCFAILFLVRSSEILVLPGGQGNTTGGVGLKANVRLDVATGGKIKSFEAVRGLDDVMELLNSDDIDEQQFELAQRALGKAIAQLGNDPNRSQRENLAYMRGLVTDRNYFRRLIAVKLLSRQQDMNNVPALIYAIGDPDIRVAIEAHNGLRLISRKLNEIPLSEEPDYAELRRVKEKWTEWFLKIRPGAELLD